MRAIEELEVGDKVWAYDEETGGKALKEVEEVFVSETDKLIHVETDKEEIITTELHPFYVEGLGFVQAGCLQEGYELVCLDGGKETITDVRVEWLDEAVEVYNFKVADYHTYFVGDGDVLVHNTTCSKTGGSDGNQLALPGPGETSVSSRRVVAEQKLADAAAGIDYKVTDPLTGVGVGRFIADDHGNIMIEPIGGSTVLAGKNGVDTHTLYPNGSNYQRYNPMGHGNNTTPHGHGHLMGTGPGRKGQGDSIDVFGNVVPYNSSDAHWTIH